MRRSFSTIWIYDVHCRISIALCSSDAESAQRRCKWDKSPSDKRSWRRTVHRSFPNIGRCGIFYNESKHAACHHQGSRGQDLGFARPIGHHQLVHMYVYVFSSSEVTLARKITHNSSVWRLKCYLSAKTSQDTAKLLA
jgi:hypothetical protein